MHRYTSPVSLVPRVCLDEALASLLGMGSMGGMVVSVSLVILVIASMGAMSRSCVMRLRLLIPSISVINTSVMM